MGVGLILLKSLIDENGTNESEKDLCESEILEKVTPISLKLKSAPQK